MPVTVPVTRRDPARARTPGPRARPGRRLGPSRVTHHYASGQATSCAGPAGPTGPGPPGRPGSGSVHSVKVELVLTVTAGRTASHGGTQCRAGLGRRGPRGRLAPRAVDSLSRGHGDRLGPSGRRRGTDWQVRSLKTRLRVLPADGGTVTVGS